jgi:cold shock CspA family protein
MRPNRDYRQVANRHMAPLEFRGHVKFFRSDKGYGFIETDGADIFFHRNSLFDDAFPVKGDEVKFAAAYDGGKYAAVRVKVLS